MTETLFYHLERRSLEEILPGLVEKSLGRGWRAAIKTDSSERSHALDTLLWTYDDQSFLPHAQQGDGDPAGQPVLITVEEGNPNCAQIFFYVGGALPADWQRLAIWPAWYCCSTGGIRTPWPGRAPPGRRPWPPAMT